MRLAALGAARELRVRRALRWVELALADPDPGVREMACSAFARLRQPGSNWRMLLPLLDSSGCASWRIDPGDELLPYLESKRGRFDRHDRALMFRSLDYETQRLLGDDASDDVLFAAVTSRKPESRTVVDDLDDVVRRVVEGAEHATYPLDELAGVSLDRNPGARKAGGRVGGTKAPAVIYRDAFARQFATEGSTNLAEEYLATREEREKASVLRDMFRQWDLRDAYPIHRMLIGFASDDLGDPALLPDAERREAIRGWLQRLGGRPE